MKKMYTVFEITKSGKLKDLNWNRYTTEEECFNNDVKKITYGEWVILPIYVYLD